MLLAMEFAKAATKAASASSYILYIYIAVAAGFYFLFLRPRNKKMKAQREEARAVEVGDRAVTIGGQVGVVTKIENGLITLRSESGDEMQFITRAINSRYVEPVLPEEPISESETDSGSEGDAH